MSTAASTVVELPAQTGRVGINTPSDIGQATAIEQARAVAEVAAAVRVAQDNPRDEARAIERMRSACAQKALAERAFFSLPRGGRRIEGSTVHLARELARCWGNNDYGVRELRRDDTEGISEMQAWAWDQEVNVRSSRSFVVPHAIMAGQGADKHRKFLTDLADITNNNNSQAARALRETIFGMVPIWFREEAERLCAETLKGGGGKTLTQQIADVLSSYSSQGVTEAQLEARLERPRSKWTPQDLAVLRVVWSELGRGEKRIEEEFPQQRLTAELIAQQQAEKPAKSNASKKAVPESADPADPDEQTIAELNAEATEQAAEATAEPESTGLFE